MIVEILVKVFIVLVLIAALAFTIGIFRKAKREDDENSETPEWYTGTEVVDEVKETDEPLNFDTAYVEINDEYEDFKTKKDSSENLNIDLKVITKDKREKKNKKPSSKKTTKKEK